MNAQQHNIFSLKGGLCSLTPGSSRTNHPAVLVVTPLELFSHCVHPQHFCLSVMVIEKRKRQAQLQRVVVSHQQKKSINTTESITLSDGQLD